MAAVIGCSGGGGRLISFDTEDAAPLSLSISGTELSTLGVASSVQAVQRVAAQLQNTLRDSIYITPFGDLPEDIRVSFIANRHCNSDDTSIGVIEYYLANRLHPDINTSISTITIGSAAFRSVLTGMIFAGSVQDTPILQGTLLFKGWPQ